MDCSGGFSENSLFRSVDDSFYFYKLISQATVRKEEKINSRFQLFFMLLSFGKKCYYCYPLV